MKSGLTFFVEEAEGVGARVLRGLCLGEGHLAGGGPGALGRRERAVARTHRGQISAGKMQIIINTTI